MARSIGAEIPKALVLYDSGMRQTMACVYLKGDMVMRVVCVGGEVEQQLLLTQLPAALHTHSRSLF